jgi:hypothetical protein
LHNALQDLAQIFVRVAPSEDGYGAVQGAIQRFLVETCSMFQQTPGVPRVGSGETIKRSICDTPFECESGAQKWNPLGAGR